MGTRSGQQKRGTLQIKLQKMNRCNYLNRSKGAKQRWDKRRSAENTQMTGKEIPANADNNRIRHENYTNITNSLSLSIYIYIYIKPNGVNFSKRTTDFLLQPADEGKVCIRLKNSNKQRALNFILFYMPYELPLTVDIFGQPLEHLKIRYRKCSGIECEMEGGGQSPIHHFRLAHHSLELPHNNAWEAHQSRALIFPFYTDAIVRVRVRAIRGTFLSLSLSLSGMCVRLNFYHR
eukprot:gene9676-6773_t